MLFLENSTSVNFLKPSKANVCPPSFCFRFELSQWESGSTIQNPSRIWGIWSMGQNAESQNHHWPRRADTSTQLGSCLITAGSQSWISGNVSYLVQHQKLSSSRKKKAVSKSMWELLPKMRPALLQRACICFLIIALTQVCNMQRLNQTV